MIDEGTRERFEKARGQYFEPLCHALELISVQAVLGDGFAMVSGASGSIRVYFEYEQGLCSFGIGLPGDSKPLCSVDEIAERFPRVRLPGEGSQRLSLDEQRAFLEHRWTELQRMFSPEHLSETRQWRATAIQQNMKKWTRGR